MTDITNTPTREYDAQLGDYFALLKPRVMSLVVFTAFVGLLAAPVSVNPVIGFCAILFSPSAAAPRARSTCGGMPISTR